jgi:hypothetical protein
MTAIRRGGEIRLGPGQDLRESLLPAEDELVLAERGGEHAHPVLLEKTGVLERAPRGPVEDGEVDAQVTGRVEGRDDRARPGLYVLHATSRS